MQYWQQSVYLPFLDVVLASIKDSMKPCFSQEKSPHFEYCKLTSTVTDEHDKKVR